MNVRNIIYTCPACISIWTSTETSTSAPCVAGVLWVVMIWQHTGEVILERNRLNVVFAANDLEGGPICMNIAEFTVERNRSNVFCVTSSLRCLRTSTSTWQCTWECSDRVVLERKHINVLFAANSSQDRRTCLITAELIVERNRSNVTCVTGRLQCLQIWPSTWESTCRDKLQCDIDFEFYMRTDLWQNCRWNCWTWMACS